MSVQKTNHDTSQAGEGAFLRALVQEDWPPYVVDVGAHDGMSLSNSYPFIQGGWTAVMVEPLPQVFAALSQRFADNPNVTCVNKACSSAPGRMPLFIGQDGPGGMLSTLCQDDNWWFRQVRTRHRIDVDVDTLTNLLSAQNFPKDFSLLLIDTEGMDYDVLQGLDFDMFRPRVIVSEQYILNQPKHNGRFRLLFDRGYVMCNQIGCNYVFVLRECLP